MRNVTIWEFTDAVCDMPPYARVYVYKGNRRTLNEFLSPNFIQRDDHIVPRDRDVVHHAVPCELNHKGLTVVMGYSSLGDLEKGVGTPLVVFNTHEHSVHWMIKNGYEFHGEESDRFRRRKVKVVDIWFERKQYQKIADEYQRGLDSNKTTPDMQILPCVDSPPKIVTLPAKKLVENKDGLCYGNSLFRIKSGAISVDEKSLPSKAPNRIQRLINFFKFW